MASVLQAESSLTDRFQTTVPGLVRKALKLGKRAKIRYALQADGTVVMSRAVVEKQDDPVLGQFLSFLAADMRARPERIQAVSPAWLKRVRSLVRGVKSDRNAPLDPSDE